MAKLPEVGTDTSDITRGSGKIGTGKEYLMNDPVSYFYDKFKTSSNQYIDDKMWAEAAKRGKSNELIYYLNQRTNLDKLLETDESVIEKTSEQIAQQDKKLTGQMTKEERDAQWQQFKNYQQYLNFDDYMLALAIPLYDNTDKSRRDRKYVDPTTGKEINYGSYTDRGWAQLSLKESYLKADAEIAQARKENRGFWQALGEEFLAIQGAELSHLASGVLKFAGDIGNVLEGIVNVLGGLFTGADLGEAFLGAFDYSIFKDGAASALDDLAYHFERDYLMMVDAREAYEAGYRPAEDYNIFEHRSQGVGASYKWWGTMLTSMVDSIGYMLPSMIVTAGLSASAAPSTVFNVGGKAFSLGSKSLMLPASIGKAAGKIGTSLFYTGIFSGNISDNVQQALNNGLTIKDLNAGEIITNSAAKAVAQWAIEVTLGKIIGFSNIDRWLGIGGEEAATAITKLGKTEGKAFLAYAGKTTRSAIKEGLEEVFQDLSDKIIDQMYSLTTKTSYETVNEAGQTTRTNMYQQSADNITLRSLLDSFVVGALTEYVITGVRELAPTYLKRLMGKTPVTAINENGEIEHLKTFQTLNFTEALRSLNEWNNTLKQVTPPAGMSLENWKQARAEAAFNLTVTLDTVGQVMSFIGKDRLMMANHILNQVAQNDQASAEYQKMSNATYANTLMANFEKQYNALQTGGEYVTKLGKTIKTVKKTELDSALKDLTTKVIEQYADAFKEHNITKLETWITSDSVTNLSVESDLKFKKALDWLGDKAIIGVNGNIFVSSNQILIVPNDWLTKGDLESIIQQKGYEQVRDQVEKALNEKQKDLIVDIYSKVTKIKSPNLNEAIDAFLFDKNFFTKILLMSAEMGMKDSAINTLLTIDQLIKRAGLNELKNGTISNRAYDTLLNKAKNNLMSAFVNYATKYQNVDLDQISNDVIPIDIKEQIKKHKNVIFTNLINSLFNTKGDIAKQGEAFDGLISKFARILPKELQEALKTSFRGDTNQRIDAVMSLVILASRYTDFDKNKIVYLPSDETSAINREYFTMFNNTVGLSVADLLNGNNLENLSEVAKNRALGKHYDLDSIIDRAALAREFLFELSNKSLTVTDGGKILQVVMSNKVIKQEYLGAKGLAKFQEELQKGKITSVKDLLRPSVKLPETKIVFDNTSKSSYIREADGVIVLNKKADLITVCHELTHLTQHITTDPNTETYLAGATASTFGNLPQTIQDSIDSYISEHFPLYYAIMQDALNNDPAFKEVNQSNYIAYNALGGELQANAVLLTHMFDSGFKWRDNRSILVSPDGKTTWSMAVTPKSVVTNICNNYNTKQEIVSNVEKEVSEDTIWTREQINDKLKDSYSDLSKFMKGASREMYNPDGSLIILHRGASSKEALYKGNTFINAERTSKEVSSYSLAPGSFTPQPIIEFAQSPEVASVFTQQLDLEFGELAFSIYQKAQLERFAANYKDDEILVIDCLGNSTKNIPWKGLKMSDDEIQREIFGSTEFDHILCIKYTNVTDSPGSTPNTIMAIRQFDSKRLMRLANENTDTTYAKELSGGLFTTFLQNYINTTKDEITASDILTELYNLNIDTISETGKNLFETMHPGDKYSLFSLMQLNILKAIEAKNIWEKLEKDFRYINDLPTYDILYKKLISGPALQRNMVRNYMDKTLNISHAKYFTALHAFIKDASSQRFKYNLLEKLTNKLKLVKDSTFIDKPTGLPKIFFQVPNRDYVSGLANMSLDTLITKGDINKDKDVIVITAPKDKIAVINLQNRISLSETSIEDLDSQWSIQLDSSSAKIFPYLESYFSSNKVLPQSESEILSYLTSTFKDITAKKLNCKGFIVNLDTVYFDEYFEDSHITEFAQVITSPEYIKKIGNLADEVKGLPSLLDLEKENLNSLQASYNNTSPSLKNIISKLIALEQQFTDKADPSTYEENMRKLEQEFVNHKEALLKSFSSMTGATETSEEVKFTKESLKTAKTQLKPKTNQILVSAKRAGNTNLKYFVGQLLDKRIYSFVQNTTNNFDALDTMLQARIKKGVLTLWDISDYIQKANKMNEYTFKTIAKYIYNNEDLAEITFEDMRKLAKNLEDLSAIALIGKSYTTKKGETREAIKADYIKSDTELMSPQEMLDYGKQIESEANKNEKLANRLAEAKYTMSHYTIPREVASSARQPGYTQRIQLPAEIDPDQTTLLFFEHYDSTLNSLRNIANINKFVVAHQQEETGAEKLIALDESGEPIKTKNAKETVWNFLNRKKVTQSDEQVNDTLVDLDRADKQQVIERWMRETFALRLAQAKEKLTPEQLAKLTRKDFTTKLQQLESKIEALDALSESEIDERYLKAIQGNIERKTTLGEVLFVAEIEKQKLERQKVLPEERRMQVTQTFNNTWRTFKKQINSKYKYDKLPSDLKEKVGWTTQKGVHLLIDKKSLSVQDLGKFTTELREARNISKQTERKLKLVAKAAESMKVRLDKVTEKLKALQEESTKPSIKKQQTFREMIAPPVTKFTIKEEHFSFDSDSGKITTLGEKLLKTEWDKTRKSTVQQVENKEQLVTNGQRFFENNAEAINEADLSEIEATSKWLMSAAMNGRVTDAEFRKFSSIKLYFLGFVYSQSSPGGLYSNINQNLRQEIGNYIQALVSTGMTMGADWNSILKHINPFQAMSSAELRLDGLVIPTDMKQELFDSLETGDMAKVQAIKNKLIKYVEQNKTSKKSFWKKIVAFRSMSMLSSPITWLRNIVSNSIIKPLNKFASKIGNKVMPSKHVATQLSLTKQVTSDIQKFISKNFLENKMFDTLINNLSKYNPSDISPINKTKTGLATKEAIMTQLVLKSLYGQYYSETITDNPKINSVYKFLLARMSDDKFIREAVIRYFGKMLAEHNYELDQGITDNIMNDFASALGLAMSDYMHSDNMFNDIEKVLAERSEGLWFAYKSILPFASASWNWFKGAMKLTPIGLGKAIVNFARLENNIKKAEIDWSKGKRQINPNLTEYMIRRDLGLGVIGTIGFLIGMGLARFGIVRLEDDDYGIPKLQIGNIRIDVSSIFGSSSILAGAALIKGIKDEASFWEGLNRMGTVMLDNMPLMDILELDMYAQGPADIINNYLQSALLSYIPNFISWIAGATYSGNIKKTKFWEKAVAKVPLLNTIFVETGLISKKVNPYTGSTGSYIDALNRLIPYFSLQIADMNENKTVALGLNKGMLKGNYTINNEDFIVTGKILSDINKAYGKWNAEDLTKFYDNQLKVTLHVNGKYQSLSYNQMTDELRTRAVKNIMSNNADLAKIMAWTSSGYKYYGSDSEYKRLKAAGVTNVFKGTQGFVK